MIKNYDKFKSTYDNLKKLTSEDNPQLDVNIINSLKSNDCYNNVPLHLFRDLVSNFKCLIIDKQINIQKNDINEIFNEMKKCFISHNDNNPWVTYSGDLDGAPGMIISIYKNLNELKSHIEKDQKPEQ
jgi:hypothetical protein